MRPLLIILSGIGAAALACTSPGGGCSAPSSSCGAPAAGCGCSMNGVSLLETVTYALDELGLSENGDLRTAIRLYKKEMRTFPSKLPMNAFEGGQFRPDVYAKEASPARALQAQSDLFETIYLILNDEQKKEFPRLMGMYQHHMEFLTLPRKLCGPGNANGAMCPAPAAPGCGGKMGNTPPSNPKTPLKR